MGDSPNLFSKPPMDVGRDQGGIYRNIARVEQMPKILQDGNFSTLEWWDIVREMVPPESARDQVITSNIVDTVVFDVNGKVEQYIYTNPAGKIAVKSAGMSTAPRILDEFKKITSRIQPEKDYNEAGLNVATFTSCDNSSFYNLDAKTLTDEVKNNRLKAGILQIFVPSKGDGENNRTYSTSFWLDSTARHHMKSDRLDLDPKVSGNHGLTTTSNRDRSNNKLMENSCMLIMQVSLKFRGVIEAILYTVDILCHVECCIRQLCVSSTISFNFTSTAHNQYTNIYSLINIHIYTYAAHPNGVHVSRGQAGHRVGTRRQRGYLGH